MESRLATSTTTERHFSSTLTCVAFFIDGRHYNCQDKLIIYSSSRYTRMVKNINTSSPNKKQLHKKASLYKVLPWIAENIRFTRRPVHAPWRQYTRVSTEPN
ncbi:hypothetical protein PILCRDRAFT_256103 [Piloderma croceum F 1598]|uniref:Uncharacterized protein n=1 Tax=Piloderma croceum (strain F 1598) TaxID=765440 RepID=A0A0C3G9I8_PILCF|nr:hypothetical protein PILCRDRAFT_256103 [Piloderma croceum F 1598]